MAVFCRPARSSLLFAGDSADRSMRSGQHMFLTQPLMNFAHATATVVTLFCLSAIGKVQGAANRNASETRRIDLDVEAGGFGRASTGDISAVLQSAAGELLRYWPTAQLPSIDVYHRRYHPETHFKRAAGNRIVIGLTARDTHWAQYTFQFAHECCHALINSSNDVRGIVLLRRDTNLWLEESLCETASLFTLRALSHSWKIAPYPAWREYAPWFTAYAKQRLVLPEHNLPAGTSFVVWFGANELALRRDSANRDPEVIVATQLLPVFEKEPRGWGALAFFHRAVDHDQSLPQQFTDWHSRCPPEFQSFVAKLAAVFNVEL